MSKMPPSEIAAGDRISGVDLSGFDWTDRDLTDIELTDCQVEDAQLSGVVLRGARFRNCRFVRSRFAHADLRETMFEACVFADPDGHVGPQFAFSRLDEARFERCDLSFALFDRSSLYGLEAKTCNLRGARFNKADFSRAFGAKVIRTSACFSGCNLELADLAEARLPGCDLSNASLREADLRETDLEDADLRGSDLFQALTAGTKLAGADLRGGEVSGVDLTAAGSIAGLKVTVDQQYALLSAMGVDVHVD